jgi:serine/threonine protein kinase
MFRFLRKDTLLKFTYYYKNHNTYYFNKKLSLLMCFIIPSTTSFTINNETNILAINNNHYTTNMTNKLGKGVYGTVYEGFNIITGEKIAFKFCNVHLNEINCLIKTELYIAHTQNCILMKKAPGITYLDILKDQSISDEIKINLHKKVINKFIELGLKYSINHNDVKPEHVFIDIENNIITIVDFGRSTFTCNIENDIYSLNYGVKYHYKHCGQSFKNYIDSLIPY